MIRLKLNCDQLAIEQRERAAAKSRLKEIRRIYINRGQRVLLRACLDRGTATIDVVWHEMELPRYINPCLLGCIPGPLNYANIIERVDLVRSLRSGRHSCFISKWELVDEEAARAWLAKHSDRPAPNYVDFAEEIQDRKGNGVGTVFDCYECEEPSS